MGEVRAATLDLDRWEVETSAYAGAVSHGSLAALLDRICGDWARRSAHHDHVIVPLRRASEGTVTRVVRPKILGRSLHGYANEVGPMPSHVAWRVFTGIVDGLVVLARWGRAPALDDENLYVGRLAGEPPSRERGLIGLRDTPSGPREQDEASRIRELRRLLEGALRGGRASGQPPPWGPGEIGLLGAFDGALSLEDLFGRLASLELEAAS